MLSVYAKWLVEGLRLNRRWRLQPLKFLLVFSLPACVMLITAAPLKAHFTHFEPRIIHITNQPASVTSAEPSKAVEMYLRMPLPLLLLPENWGGLDSGEPIPFTRRIREQNDWKYYLAIDEIRTNPKALETLIQATHIITSNGRKLEGLRLEKLHIFSPHKRKPFSSLAYARTALNGEPISFDVTGGEIFDTLIDIKLILPGVDTASAITIKSALGEKLKVISRLANIVHIHRGNKTDKQVTIGVLDAAFDKTVSQLTQAINQFSSGIWHILIGLDHVLFVLLIIIAAPSWLAVLRNATGFTIGHSITLTMGVLGHMPQGAWFIPSVELIIAATIFYGAAVLILQKPEYFGFSNVLLIGLIHGYGFSFILSDVLKQAGEIDLTSILFFNLGIEAGQIMIYLLVAPLIWLAGKYHVEKNWDWRRAVALLAIAVSLFWIIDRGTTVLAII